MGACAVLGGNVVYMIFVDSDPEPLCFLSNEIRSLKYSIYRRIICLSIFQYFFVFERFSVINIGRK